LKCCGDFPHRPTKALHYVPVVFQASEGPICHFSFYESCHLLRQFPPSDVNYEETCFLFEDSRGLLAEQSKLNLRVCQGGITIALPNQEVVCGWGWDDVLKWEVDKGKEDDYDLLKLSVIGHEAHASLIFECESSDQLVDQIVSKCSAKHNPPTTSTDEQIQGNMYSPQNEIILYTEECDESDSDDSVDPIELIDQSTTGASPDIGNTHQIRAGDVNLQDDAAEEKEDQSECSDGDQESPIVSIRICWCRG
jgi:hypothetical protein